MSTVYMYMYMYMYMYSMHVYCIYSNSSRGYY